MRPVSIAVCSLACLVATWVAGCATERLDAAPPSGVNLTGEWKFNPNLSDDPDKPAQPDQAAPQRAPGGHRGHGRGSPPTAATTGHGGPGRIEIQGWLPGSELATTDSLAAADRLAPTAATTGQGWPGRAEIQGRLPGSDSAATTGLLPVAFTSSGIDDGTPPPSGAPPTTGASTTGVPPNRKMSISRILKAPMHVSITQKEGTLTIKADMPDGSHTADEYTAGTSNTIPYGPDSTADRSVGWRGPVFVVTTNAKKGGWREDDFALDEDGRLIMTTQAQGGRLGKVAITRVYDREAGL